MKYLLLALFACCTINAGAQDKNNELYFKDFKWHVTIPAGFESVPAEVWQKNQQRGKEAVEDTYDAKVVNKAKIIFVFRSDQVNYFESNYQPFDPEVDGSYAESCKGVEEILYTTFKTQMPDVKLDSSTTKETIDGLSFHVFKMSVHYGNGMTLNLNMFSRLIGKNEFTVNVMYVDKKKGDMMLKAWRESKFDKN